MEPSIVVFVENCFVTKENVNDPTIYPKEFILPNSPVLYSSHSR